MAIFVISCSFFSYFTAQAKEFEDPPGLLEKTEYLLVEWVNAYHFRDAGKESRQAFVIFVQLSNPHGILKTDDLITRFFRMSTQVSADRNLLNKGQ